LTKAIIKSTMSGNKRKFEFLVAGRVWPKQSAQATRSLDARSNSIETIYRRSRWSSSAFWR